MFICATYLHFAFSKKKKMKMHNNSAKSRFQDGKKVRKYKKNNAQKMNFNVNATHKGHKACLIHIIID